MKQMNIFGLGAACLLVAMLLLAFTNTKESKPDSYEWTHVTAIESLVAMGVGRSSLVTTTAAGKLKEEPMRNFFSATGINFKNVADNDKMITNKIQQLTDEGWELMEVTTGSAVTGEYADGGIFMTRYLLRRSK